MKVTYSRKILTKTAREPYENTEIMVGLEDDAKEGESGKQALERLKRVAETQLYEDVMTMRMPSILTGSTFAEKQFAKVHAEVIAKYGFDVEPRINVGST